MPEVRVVCFDWGGVILRICRNWKQGCERAGLRFDERVMGPEIATPRRALAAQYQLGLLTCDAFFDGVSGVTGGLYTPDDVRAVHDAWLIEEYAGVSDLIDRLNAREDVVTALLSNTNARHWSRQHDGSGGFGAAAKLKHRLASHHLGLAKPDVAIYDAATRQFGCAPDRIVFFDDLAENIASARAAGWRAVQIDHEADTAAQMRRALAEAGVQLD